MTKINVKTYEPLVQNTIFEDNNLYSIQVGGQLGGVNTIHTIIVLFSNYENQPLVTIIPGQSNEFNASNIFSMTKSDFERKYGNYPVKKITKIIIEI